MDQNNEFKKFGGEFDEPNPYAATQQNLSSNSAAVDMVLAARSTRFYATLLDGLFGLVLGAVIGIFAAILIPIIGKENQFAVIGIVGGIAAIAAIGFIVYQFTLIARYGQTMGKRIMKIRVVRTGTDEKCGLGRYFWLRGVVTGLLGAIPFVGWIVSLADPLMIFRQDRRCLHDHIADTEVVNV